MSKNINLAGEVGEFCGNEHAELMREKIGGTRNNSGTLTMCIGAVEGSCKKLFSRIYCEVERGLLQLFIVFFLMHNSVLMKHKISAKIEIC